MPMILVVDDDRKLLDMLRRTLAIPFTPAAHESVMNGGIAIETIVVGGGRLRVYTKCVKDVHDSTGIIPVVGAHGRAPSPCGGIT